MGRSLRTLEDYLQTRETGTNLPLVKNLRTDIGIAILDAR